MVTKIKKPRVKAAGTKSTGTTRKQKPENCDASQPQVSVRKTAASKSKGIRVSEPDTAVAIAAAQTVATMSPLVQLGILI